MPSWLQHSLVLALVAGCLALVFRDALRALRQQASKLAGCGSCKGCATEAKPEPAREAKPERVVFLPAETLRVRVAAKTGSK